MVSNTSIADEWKTTEVLSELDCSLIIPLLEDCYDKLVILGASKPKASHKLTYRNLKSRFTGGRIPHLEYDTESNQLKSLTGKKRREIKFEKDRGLLEKLLMITKDDLLTSHTYKSLEVFVIAETKRASDENSVRSLYKLNSTMLAQLRSSMKSDQERTQKLIIEKSSLANKLEQDLQVEKFNSGIMTTYFTKWTKVRIQQNVMKVALAEGVHKGSIKSDQKAIKRETIAHNQIVKYLEENIKGMQAKIDYWAERYSKEVEHLDIEIAQTKQKRLEEAERMAKMLRTFETREREINKYLEERAERERLAQLAFHRKVNATKIQAWWRGTMVRWQLGDYDPNKKKKKGRKK